MVTSSLFGNNIPPACEYCQESIPTAGGSQFICAHRGIVAAKYSCRKFCYDPLRRVPRPPVLFLKFDDDDFKIDNPPR